MNKRQSARVELENKIIEMAKGGASDDEIANALGCPLSTVHNVRPSVGIRKIKEPDKYYPRIEDSEPDEKPIVGVKYEYKGKKYIDITGDIIDCGIAYRR